jgi:hypothetical protein
MAEEPPKEAFLARWSRLKRAGEGAEVRGSDEPPHPNPPPQGEREKQAPYPLAGEGWGGGGVATPPTPPPTPLPPLPDLASLTAESDFTPFMDVRVPSALRAQALARAWSLDPFIRDFKEMADYAWDWNTPGGAPGYGPLDAATDIARMLSRILPEAPPPQEIASVEPPPTPAQVPVPPQAVRHSQGPIAPPQEAAQSQSIPEPEQAPVAERPRRHGGAVPT